MTQFWIFGDSLKFDQRPNFLNISWKPLFAASWFFWKLSQYLQKQNTFFAASCRRDFLKSIFEGLSRQSAVGESLNLFLFFFWKFGEFNWFCVAGGGEVGQRVKWRTWKTWRQIDKKYFKISQNNFQVHILKYLKVGNINKLAIKRQKHIFQISQNIFNFEPKKMAANRQQDFEIDNEIFLWITFQNRKQYISENSTDFKIILSHNFHLRHL